jgi:uncharacterized phage protein (TIGR02218 family)
MRTDIPEALLAHYAAEDATLTTCLYVRLKDNTEFGFTALCDDLPIAGITYEAQAGYSASALVSRADLTVDNVELQGLLSSTSIDPDDLLSGRWNGAFCELFEVNYADLTAGRNIQRRGFIGEVSTARGEFKAEIHGLTRRLQQQIIELTSASCRASLGDARCKKDLSDYTVTAAVTDVETNRQFDTDLPSTTVRLTPSTTGTPTSGYFNKGSLLWLPGSANAGRREGVKLYAPGDGNIILRARMYYDIEVGDEFEIVAGCQKRGIEDCKTKFGNIDNMRAEMYQRTPINMMKGAPS